MINNWARIAVSVLCDDARLSEHDVKALDDRTAVCYVPSEVGKPFSIVYENRLSYGLLVCIHFDGALVGSYYSAPGTDSIVSGAQVGTNLERPLLFSRPTRLGTDTDAGGYPKTAQSGSIQVDFYRYAAVWECDSFAPEPRTVNPIPDPAKDAGAHRIRLGDATPAKPRPQIQGHVLDAMGDPYARFLFHYGPRDVLRGPRGLTLPPLRALRAGARDAAVPRLEGGAPSVARPMQLYALLH